MGTRGIDMPGASTTGDIIWKKLDPTTYYLYNNPSTNTESTTEPDPYTVGQGTAMTEKSEEAKALQQMMGIKNPELERAMFQHDVSNYGTAEAMKRATRHFHHRQLAEFNRDLINDPNIDVQKRFQQLIDSGAMWIDKNGDLYSSVPLASHVNKRILEASKTWQPEDITTEQPDEDTQSFKDQYEKQMQIAGMMGQSTDEGE